MRDILFIELFLIVTPLSSNQSPLIFILIVAGFITLALGIYVDSLVIFLAISINAIIGIYQEGRATLAFKKLSELQGRNAIAIRETVKKVLPAIEIVPGDIIAIESGMYIPADARIIYSENLEVNESALTGEWLEVKKKKDEIKVNSSLTEQYNMLWMGTLVTAGAGLAIVVSHGENTKIGGIAQSLKDTKKSTTPLQESIKNLAQFIAYIVLAALFIILLIGIYRGEELSQMLLISIAIAVSAVPEGLPAAVTVILAIGMEKILARGGLVRNLLAAETLGSTTVIMTDKTGTLTKAEMHVASIITFRSLKKSKNKGLGTLRSVHGDERRVLESAIYASDAFIESESDLGEPIVHGRPVESAIVFSGLRSGINQTELLHAFPRTDFISFESSKPFAASLHVRKKLSKNILYLSGSPDYLLDHANRILIDGKTQKKNKQIVKSFQDKQRDLSSEGKRLIGVAYKLTNQNKFKHKSIESVKHVAEGSIFAGFIVLHDPIRKDVKGAIKTAKAAGARIIMATGDHASTALKIATIAGISKKKDKVLLGSDIDKLSNDEIKKSLKHTTVFARMLPEHKLRLVKILKEDGGVVAMTGDGINDAPALKSADIGIALGAGTEVAKEASDLILLNNSFSIIVYAIEEGRRIIDNLRKVITYLLSTSFSEIITVMCALLFVGTLPFLPVQLLWTNIVHEGFMNFAFAFEPAEKDIMKRNHHDTSIKSIINSNVKTLIIAVSIINGIFLVAVFLFLYSLNWDISIIRTYMFIALSASTTFFAFSLKDFKIPLWKINIFSNSYLLLALLFSFTSLITALYFPPLRELLSLTKLLFGEVVVIMIVSASVNIIAVEVTKYFFNKLRYNSQHHG